VEHLTLAQRQQLRDALQAERERVGGRIDADAAQAVPDDFHGDIQDDAAEQMRIRHALDRSARDVDRIAEIDAALRRMEDGSYGICEETGEDIPFGRLRLQPATRYTVEALELLESERARRDVVGGDVDEEEAY
jgi:DnaK suppressor protein